MEQQEPGRLFTLPSWGDTHFFMTINSWGMHNPWHAEPNAMHLKSGILCYIGNWNDVHWLPDDFDIIVQYNESFTVNYTVKCTDNDPRVGPL